MESDKERIERLETAYRKLWQDHEELKVRIKANYAEFNEIRTAQGLEKQFVPVKEQAANKPIIETVVPALPIQKTITSQPLKSSEKTSIEQFIGEQLLSKIGILIVIIGVGIGAKYAIDHQLLSEGVRVLLGYLVAGVLGVFAYRFRSKYQAFSAVLASGALAVCYFMTYAAYAFYGIIPYGLAFSGLLITVVMMIALALYYNLVIIAHFGLIAAYILPALISTNQQHISYYLAYMLIINAGILVLTVLKDWKSMHYPVIIWTNIVFLGWFIFSYNETTDGLIALAYLTLFFLLFFTATIIRPLLKKETFNQNMLLRSLHIGLAFYLFSKYVLDESDFSATKSGFFSLTIVALYFISGYSFWKKKEFLIQQTHLLMGISFLVFTVLFDTSLQLRPLIITVQALLLLYFAVKTKWLSLHITSSILFLIAFFQLAILMTISSFSYSSEIEFHSSDLIYIFWGIVGLNVGGIYYLKPKIRDTSILFSWQVLLGFSYVIFVMAGCWNIDYSFPTPIFTGKTTSDSFQHITEIKYAKLSLIVSFMMSSIYLVGWLRIHYFEKSKQLEELWIVMGIMAIIVLLFIVTNTAYFGTTSIHPTTGLGMLYIFGRYIFFFSIVGCFWIFRALLINIPFLLATASILFLWILSLELIQWLTYSGLNSYKLALSILWGSYAISMLFYGIKRNLSALRLASMFILGITVVKLFLIDLSTLGTLSKTIVFVLLGGLILVGAYFYQRFTVQFSDKKTEEEISE